MFKNTQLQKHIRNMKDTTKENGYEFENNELDYWCDLVEHSDNSYTKHSILKAMQDVLFDDGLDRKSTRLNSSHVAISYAVFCLKKKKKKKYNVIVMKIISKVVICWTIIKKLYWRIFLRIQKLEY